MILADLDRLEAAARAATEGPWAESFRGYTVTVGQAGGVFVAQLHWGEPSLSHAEAEANATFIAAADPPTVLALVALCRELVEAARPLAAVAVRHGPEWPDETPTETRWVHGEEVSDPTGPTVGDYRRAAALLARIGG